MLGVLKRLGILIVQTIGGLISAVVITVILATVIEAIVPYDYGTSMCEYFCPGYAGVPILVAAPTALITSIWLIGKFFGQRGSWWLTGLGMIIGAGVAFTSGVWGWAMYLPIVLDILVPALAIPFFAALMYQLSSLIMKQSEAVEVKS